MKYYKILNKEEKHYDMQYKTGLNTDILPFNPTGDCQAGGIYFASCDILGFLEHGNYIREVTLLGNEEVYENPGFPTKYKAHSVILGRKRRITKKVISELLDEGANIHANDDLALHWASDNGNFEIVKLLLDKGANIHANNDQAFRSASYNGHLEIVKLFLDRGADINALDGSALSSASHYDYYKIVKLLLDKGADIHANDDYALYCAFRNNNTKIVDLLKEYMKK